MDVTVPDTYADSLVCVCVVRQSVHEDSMAWHVAGVLQDNNAIANWMIIDIFMAGIQDSTCKFHLWKNLSVWLVKTASKRPDGVTLLPWARGKPSVWDVTVPDTYADSHLADTVTMAGAAADKAASTKETKYRQLANSLLFVPVAIETAGTWNHLAVVLQMFYFTYNHGLTLAALNLHWYRRHWQYDSSVVSSTQSCFDGFAFVLSVAECVWLGKRITFSSNSTLCCWR